MSKSFGLAGLRLGWIACRNRAVLEKMATFKDYTTICTAAPVNLATLALRHHERILKRNRRSSPTIWAAPRFHAPACRAFFLAGTAGRAGGLSACSFAEHSDDFCADLLQKKGVLLLPGACSLQPRRNSASASVAVISRRDQMNSRLTCGRIFKRMTRNS